MLRRRLLHVLVLAGAMLLTGPIQTGHSQEQAADTLKLHAYTAAMRSDLRNLISMQESYFADNVTYATSMPILEQYGLSLQIRAQHGFKASSGVTLVILTSSGWGWSGIAIHREAPGFVCGISVGNMSPPLHADAAEGEPTCKGPDGKRFH